MQYDERFYARLRQRTAVGGAVIFLIPFLLFTLLVQFASEKYVRKQWFERLRAGATMNAHLLDDVLNVRRREVQSLPRTLEKELMASAQAAMYLPIFPRVVEPPRVEPAWGSPQVYGWPEHPAAVLPRVRRVY